MFRCHPVLARLEAFLPELKRANETLDPTEASIEQEDEDMQGTDVRRIEMVSTSAVAFAVLGQLNAYCGCVQWGRPRN